jgi:hypothetical protein
VGHSRDPGDSAPHIKRSVLSMEIDRPKLGRHSSVGRILEYLGVQHQLRALASPGRTSVVRVDLAGLRNRYECFWTGDMGSHMEGSDGNRFFLMLFNMELECQVTRGGPELRRGHSSGVI